MTDPSGRILRRRMLERRKIGYQYRLGPDVLDALDVEIEHVMIGVMARFSSLVWTEKLAAEKHTVEHRVPDTWWDHWKHDHAPAWFVRRWPVTYRTITTHVRFERRAVYPESSFGSPGGFGPYVIWENVWDDGPYGI